MLLASLLAPNWVFFCLSHPDAKHKAESELTLQTRPRSNTLPKSFGSTLDQSAHEDPVESEAQDHRPLKEETLELIQHSIQTKRAEDSWPEDVRVSSSVLNLKHTDNTNVYPECTVSRFG